jgi:phosphate transport system substrate-binding protein
VGVVVAAAACGGTGSLAEAIVADLPVVDGSTSTQPMRLLLLCGLLDTPCGWEEDFLSAERWVAAGDRDSPEAQLLEEHVVTSGTHEAYESLVAGESDVIVVARAPSDEERAAAEAAGVGLEVEAVALDAFVFLVNDANPVEGLTVDQVRGIYSGQITDWSQVGGPALPIQPYQRDPTSGSQELMIALVMHDVPMIEAPDWLMLYSMSGPFSTLTRDESGIGYSVYFYAEYMAPAEHVEMIAVDGVLPTTETIGDGEYPLVSEVFAVVRSGETGSGRAFFDWLVTEEGQQAVAGTGYVPLPAG